MSDGEDSFILLKDEHADFEVLSKCDCGLLGGWSGLSDFFFLISAFLRYMIV